MWEALGYTPQTYEAAWQSVFARYESGFPQAVCLVLAVQRTPDRHGGLLL